MTTDEFNSQMTTILDSLKVINQQLKQSGENFKSIEADLRRSGENFKLLDERLNKLLVIAESHNSRINALKG